MNDLDIWEQAFKTMNLNENIQFVSRGRLITEASQVEMFNKIQALLNADGMECSHKWLYSLDPTDLNEAEATKVNNLYKLGCDRGIIECGETEEEKANEDEVVALEVAVQPVAPAPIPVVPTSAYTILYSAMRNGEIKTGEAYSNSINPRSAKADVISQLERAGYTNINILAIECGDPDQCGNECSNTFCKQPEVTSTEINTAIPDYSNDSINTVTFEDDSEKDIAEASKDTDDKESDNEKNSDDNKKTEDEDNKTDSEEDKSDNKEVKDDSSDDKKEEDAEEPDEKLKDDTELKADKASDKENKEDKELDASEKAALKDSYKKAFKAAMLKCKFEDLSFDDLSLEQKVDFFTLLNKQWNKIDPVKFMSDKELDLLESIIVKQ